MVKDYFKFIGIALLVIITVSFLGFLVNGGNLLSYKFFAPKTEQVRRETFEQSKAYNQGMIQELQNMQFEYIKATPEQQIALKSVILHRAADYPEDKMPNDLHNFIEELKR